MMKHAMVPTAALVVLVALFPALAAVAADDDRPWPAVEDRLVLSPCHTCNEEQGSYAPGSAYEANLQLLAATIPAKVNAESCNCSNGNMAGDSPDIVVASAYCPRPWRDGANSSDCGACVALAFREAQRLCPYHRQAEVVVDGGACTLNFHDYDLMEEYQHSFHDYDQHMDMGVAPTTGQCTHLSTQISSVLFIQKHLISFRSKEQ